MSLADNSVKIEGELDTYKATITINLLQVLKELDEDQKMELLWDGGWWSLIDEEMANAIVTEISGEHYNPQYTKLRQLILNGESMPEIIRRYAITKEEDRILSEQKARYYCDAYFKLYHWSIDQKGERPVLPSFSYKTPYSNELMEKIKEEVKDFGELFPEEDFPKFED